MGRIINCRTGKRSLTVKLSWIYLSSINVSRRETALYPFPRGFIVSVECRCCTYWITVVMLLWRTVDAASLVKLLINSDTIFILSSVSVHLLSFTLKLFFYLQTNYNLIKHCFFHLVSLICWKHIFIHMNFYRNMYIQSAKVKEPRNTVHKHTNNKILLFSIRHLCFFLMWLFMCFSCHVFIFSWCWLVG